MEPQPPDVRGSRRRPRGGAARRLLQEHAAELGVSPAELARQQQRERTAREAEGRVCRWVTNDPETRALPTASSAKHASCSSAQPTWQFVAASGRAELTGRSITTVRHGGVGSRPEVLFSCLIEPIPAAPPQTGQQPPQLLSEVSPGHPTRLWLSSRLNGRVFETERLSTSAWDALPLSERALRLQQARHCWEVSPPFSFFFFFFFL